MTGRLLACLALFAAARDARAQSSVQCEARIGATAPGVEVSQRTPGGVEVTASSSGAASAGMDLTGGTAGAPGFVVTHSDAPAVRESEPPPGGPRIRFGVDLGVGALLARVGGPAVVAGLRLGWQFGDVFGLHYQGNLPVGFAFGTATDANGSAQHYGGALALVTNALLAEFTGYRVFHAALGPSLDYVLTTVCPEHAAISGRDCIGATGLAPGAHLRVSVTAGWRHGIQLGIDLHPVFASTGVLAFATASFGYEWH